MPTRDTRQPKLLEQVRRRLRVGHYSLRTEKTYIPWIKRYILFHGKRHPRDMGKADIEAFLTHLAVDRHVSAATQNQALAAILFLYRTVPRNLCITYRGRAGGFARGLARKGERCVPIAR